MTTLAVVAVVAVAVASTATTTTTTVTVWPDASVDARTEPHVQLPFVAGYIHNIEL
jgi:hypothetical protein